MLQPGHEMLSSVRQNGLYGSLGGRRKLWSAREIVPSDINTRRHGDAAMKSPLPLLPTTLVGSYAQPDWLIDRENLRKRFPPRVRARELWRVAPEWLEQAQDDATILAIRDQERAGLDIITDGEMRRESYSNRFATALEGVD